MTDQEWEALKATFKPVDAGFAAWMADVNKAVAAKMVKAGVAGLDANDLLDQPYEDWFEDGMTAKAAAARAVRNEMKGEVG